MAVPPYLSGERMTCVRKGAGFVLFVQSNTFNDAQFEPASLCVTKQMLWCTSQPTTLAGSPGTRVHHNKAWPGGLTATVALAILLPRVCRRKKMLHARRGVDVQVGTSHFICRRDICIAGLVVLLRAHSDTSEMTMANE